MKAAVIEKQGGLENLVYRDWEDPKPDADEVLIRVRACGLNHLDIFVRRGMLGFPVPMPFISGGDIAGEISALGPSVKGWKVGDRVVVNPATKKGLMGEQIFGGLAEFVCAPAANLIRLPAHVDYGDGAAIPIAYGTAVRMLFDIGGIEKDDLILILGASGGVGLACAQLAKLFGARVIAAAGSAEKCRRLEELGTDYTIDYSIEDFSREAWRLSDKKGVDVVVNHTGGQTFVPSMRALRRRGKLLVCGATAGYDFEMDLRYLWMRQLQILGSSGYTTANIETAMGHVSAGRLRPVIGQRLPLSEAREAERLMEDRAFFGKIIITQ